MEQEHRNTLRKYFQSLRIIHAALLILLIGFLVLVRFVVLDSQLIDAAHIEDPLLRFTPTVALLLGILTGEFLFQKRLKEARKAPTLVTRLNRFRSASVVRWLAVSAPSFFALIWFMSFADKFFMAIALVGMALLAFSRPSVTRAGRALDLSDEELAQLEDLLK